MPDQMGVVTSDTSAPGAARLAGRAAQVLLGIPLGLFQLAAVLVFTFTGAVVTPQDWFVAIWGVAMSSACAVLALRVYRSARARWIAFALLGVQVAFSFVKYFVYHESAALVFGVLVVLALVSLGIYHRSNPAERAAG
jgi:hypothetical protein